ncbi:hypothetical protein HYPGJ_31453 [Hyphomicrobium sp. GJ21]|uniref:hypothetical protein n=1 Tax=Hyphomicrobium sp. GJ21 TaxID=113574 RepID=UPI000622C0B8|nr:hypothetical protein [Hyphomicrobium sp. GJ21]CEJ87900.1 hypothetical protein HYPGJ_31453 [Hyphomicrobium sp. GJ21]
MNSIDIRAEVHRVIGGKVGGPAIAFPHDPRALDVVVHTTRTFVNHARAITDAQRVQFIRKFAIYIIRTGWGETDTIQHMAGVIWFSNHPEQLTTRLGFGSAIYTQYQAFQHREKDQQYLTEDAVIADLTRLPIPAKPVQLTVGDFVLEQLVHAAHLLEIGTTLTNCLRTPHGNGFLPNTMYWTPVKRKQRHLFTIRHRTLVCLLLQITKDRITQVQFNKPPKDFFVVFPHFADRIQEMLGPVDAGAFPALWPTAAGFLQPTDPGQLALFKNGDTGEQTDGQL